MKKKDFRVIPGMTLRSSEIRKRWLGGQLKPSTDGQIFDSQRDVVAIAGMNRTDVARSFVKDRDRVKALEDKINADQGRARKEAERKRDAELVARAKKEAIEEHAKSKGNG